MPLLDLPDEVLDEICGHLGEWQPSAMDWNQDVKRRQNMLSVCLASKRLLSAGRKALYRYPTLACDPRYQPYDSHRESHILWSMFITSITAYNHLAQYIHAFQASSSTLPEVSFCTSNLRHLSLSILLEDEDDTYQLDQLRVIISTFPRLQRLLLDLWDVPDNGQCLRKAFSVCPSGFRGELQLRGMQFYKISAAVDGNDLVLGWQEISHLYFLECYLTAEIRRELCMHVRSSRLAKVDFFNCDLGYESAIPIFEIFPTSVTELTIDEGENRFPGPELARFRRLKSLTLMSCCDLESLDALLSHLPDGLRTLCIGNLFAAYMPLFMYTLVDKLGDLQGLSFQLRAEDMIDWEPLYKEWKEVLRSASFLDGYCKELGIITWPPCYECALRQWKNDGTEQYWPGYRYLPRDGADTVEDPK